MGISILELVLEKLREARFAAEVAYPGQKFPRITQPAAAAHIERVDRAAMSVTVEVSIICPAELGGTTCETEALRATEVLRWSGAVCVQNGCTYDGVAQVYMVQILATFTGVAEEDAFVNGPGFWVYIDGVPLMNVVSVSEEEITGIQAECAMGEKTYSGISAGGQSWSIRLEERIPSGYPEAEEPEGSFVMKIVTPQKTEVYSGCRWTGIQREFSREGLRRIRTGFAKLREEV